jgi:hypothetical protein
MATWTDLTYAFGSLLTSTKMTQNQANFTALSEGAGGAPVITNAVGQAGLKTSTGEVSTSSSTPANFTLPGGTYGFYPQVKETGDGMFAALSAGTGQIGATYVTNIGLRNNTTGTASARQRYITASAPFNLGNGDIPLFVFAILDINGDVIGTYVADTPPWFYNGRPENTFDARKYKKKKGKDNYFYDRSLPLPDKETDFAGYLAAINNPDFKNQTEEIEITPEVKNLDMDIIRHPFMSNDLTDKIVVLLDPVGSMAEKMRDLHDMGESVADLLHANYLLIDNEDAGANSPVGVKTHKVKWR